jgi:hypothetical protein
MDLPCLFPAVEPFSTPYDASVTKGWKYDNLSEVDLAPHWDIEWCYSVLWNEWQSFPGDGSWLLEHAFGPIGQVRPLAFGPHGDALLRAGGLHFVMNFGAPVEDVAKLYVFPASAQPRQVLGAQVASIGEVPPRETAFLERNKFNAMWQKEVNTLGRNRWIEQKMRGGRPPPNLLIMPFRHMA